MRANPNLVNKYAKDFGFSDCKTENGQIVQKVEIIPVCICIHLHSFDKTNFDNILLEDRPTFGVILVLRASVQGRFVSQKPELIDYFISNEAGFSPKRTKRMLPRQARRIVRKYRF